MSCNVNAMSYLLFRLKVLHIDVTNQDLIDAAFNVVSASVGSEGKYVTLNLTDQ
jgi:hypothetical protein